VAPSGIFVTRRLVFGYLQVSHIFSDKTGTLTSNRMEFRRLIVDNVTFGVGDTAISRLVAASRSSQASSGLLSLSPRQQSPHSRDSPRSTAEDHKYRYEMRELTRCILSRFLV
jgi:magnesium-transporting ATPase (P-type)